MRHSGKCPQIHIPEERHLGLASLLMHLNGYFLKSLFFEYFFLNTVEAKVIILTGYVQSSVYKLVIKVKVDLSAKVAHIGV